MSSCSSNPQPIPQQTNLSYEDLLADKTLNTAIFAGGCFWCSEDALAQADGVAEVFSGYTGGGVQSAKYESVSSGKTKHREAILVFYDPEKISYSSLLTYYWKHINPTDSSGRADYIHENWDNDQTFPTPNSLTFNDMKKKLTPLQYNVTQNNGTERPFDNPYWDNKQEGIYVDIVSGEVLFSSKDKFTSGTGWPSFTKPLEKKNIVEKSDKSLLATRTEIRSKNADSHLGHVFPDGPSEKGGLRYCINSASLRFIKNEDLEDEGYGEWK